MLYTDITNFHPTSTLAPFFTMMDKKKFLRVIRNFFWENPYVFKYCQEQIITRCIPKHVTR